ncbi:MAG: hypothetical protein JO269_07425 [Burkholderiaceae bacterium]|nr:hypothetical protein [Burkholderiaceae bacterium]
MADQDPDKLPRRDFILLPLIALLTALLLGGGAELVAGLYFDETQIGNCGTPDPVLPYRYAPACSFRNKAAEGPLVDYRFNECGYRSIESCKNRAPGSTRIALLGASTAEGFKIDYRQALAPRAAAALSTSCRRPVEIQNMGVAGYHVIDQYLRTDEALALKPDLVALVVTPYELVDLTDPQVLQNRAHPERIEKKPSAQAKETANRSGLVARVSAWLSNSRAALFAQYLLFQNREKYVDLFLMHGDKADYLRPPFTPLWEKRLSDFDLLVGEMADRFHHEGVPFAIVFTPQRIQAALMDNRPAGVDPAAIDRRIAEISARHGITFVDTYENFHRVAHAETLFFPVDGHMTASGHGVVAHGMAQGLLDAKLPVFAGCADLPRSDPSAP